MKPEHMTRVVLRASAAILLAAAGARADFSMEQTSQITGGALAGAMKVVGVFSKEAREPIRSTVAVSGDRMAHLSQASGSIIDLSKETITHIDFRKKTYSVMTFAQMKQMLDEMSRKMNEKKDEGADLKFNVSVDRTGKTKQIAGMEAKETVLKVVMEGTDKKSGQSGSIEMISDMWMAPRVAGYQEVTDFYKRMAEKLDWMPGSSMMMMRPEMTKGMAELYKEAAKMDGMPVYQVVTMGGSGAPATEGTGSQAPPPASETQAEKPSVGSALGSALGGRFGRFGKKKKQEPPAEQQPAAQPQSAPGALMEMTIETSNFSSAPVDPSKFEVPAGFKQVEPDLKTGR